MKPPPRIETERLLLRPPQMQDAESIYTTYAQDPEVVRYLPWLPHTTIETTRNFVQWSMDAWSGEHRFPWVITLKAKEVVVGMVELRPHEFHASLGYVLARSYWNQGIMSEAVQPLVDWALAQPLLYRVWAICDKENIGSARVMEKVGMQREGLMRRGVIHPNVSLEPRDCWLYAKVK
ncbi:MAG: GNAT family N-acetyltransferase [Caldilineaceae bacterium]